MNMIYKDRRKRPLYNPFARGLFWYGVCLFFKFCFFSPFNVRLYSNNIHEPDRKHQVSETLLVDRSAF